MPLAERFSNELDRLPILGHIKGVLHIIDGDTNRGKNLLVEATRTTVVMGCGIATSLYFKHPAFGALGGIAGGLAFDGLHSIVVLSPRGSINLYVKAYSERSAEKLFKAILCPLRDAGYGLAAGFAATHVVNNYEVILTSLRAVVDKDDVATYIFKFVVKKCIQNRSGNCNGGDPIFPGPGRVTGPSRFDENSTVEEEETISERSVPPIHFTPNCNCYARGINCQHVIEFATTIPQGLVRIPGN